MKHEPYCNKRIRLEEVQPGERNVRGQCECGYGEWPAFEDYHQFQHLPLTERAQAVAAARHRRVKAAKAGAEGRWKK